jgi:hypothetical protein
VVLNEFLHLIEELKNIIELSVSLVTLICSSYKSKIRINTI